MQLITVIIVLFAISVAWALLSLRGVLKRNESLHAKKELKKGRVLFYKPGHRNK